MEARQQVAQKLAVGLTYVTRLLHADLPKSVRLKSKRRKTKKISTHIYKIDYRFLIYMSREYISDYNVTKFLLFIACPKSKDEEKYNITIIQSNQVRIVKIKMEKRQSKLLSSVVLKA